MAGEWKQTQVSAVRTGPLSAALSRDDLSAIRVGAWWGARGYFCGCSGIRTARGLRGAPLVSPTPGPRGTVRRWGREEQPLEVEVGEKGGSQLSAEPGAAWGTGLQEREDALEATQTLLRRGLSWRLEEARGLWRQRLRGLGANSASSERGDPKAAEAGLARDHRTLGPAGLPSLLR